MGMEKFDIDRMSYNSRFKETSVLRHKKALNCGMNPVSKLHFPSSLLSYFSMKFCQEIWDDKRERTSFGE
jgi:hypothetical protein